MILSFSKKFIFIHVYKTAGRSMRQALSPYLFHAKRSLPARFLYELGLSKYVTNPRLKVYPHHMPAREAKALLPSDIFDEFYKFGFARNPWDWQVSMYLYMLRHPEHKQHEFIKSLQSFDRYIDWRVHKDLHFQSDYLCDEDGQLLCDYLGRFENLHEDFAHICQHLKLDVTLPHENKSERQSYREYYNSETEQMVREAFAPDINLLGYQF